MALALVALAAVGCASDAPKIQIDTGLTRLVVREYDGERLVRTQDLHCGGTRSERCTRIIELLPALRPRADEVCTALYGGPERRVIRGQIGGLPVRVEVTRIDGCQIARYDLLTRALG